MGATHLQRNTPVSAAAGQAGVGDGKALTAMAGAWYPMVTLPDDIMAEARLRSQEAAAARRAADPARAAVKAAMDRQRAARKQVEDN